MPEILNHNPWLQFEDYPRGRLVVLAGLGSAVLAFAGLVADTIFGTVIEPIENRFSAFGPSD